MNAYAWIILVALLVEYGLNLVGNRLNLSSLQLALPDEFRGSFDDERYTKSQDYTRTKTRFSMVMASFDLALLLVFWLSGGFAWLDTWALSLIHI